MARFSLEELDEWADYAEAGTAAAGLALTGATIAAPNPVTGALAVGTNIASAGIDLYQGIRSAIKGEWGKTAKNAGELILSLVGAKGISEGSKLMKLDKALDATNAPRQYVYKTVGRGRGKTRAKFTKEQSKASTYHGIGFGASLGANASSGSVINDITERDFRRRNSIKYIEPQDNTFVKRPVIIKKR